MAAESSPTHDPYAAFRVPAYRNYAIGGFISVIGRQMLAMSVGFEIFLRTNSKTAIGLFGLMGALPVIFLSLPAGYVSDRLSRKWIILTTQAALLLTSVGLALLASGKFAIAASGPLALADRALASISALFADRAGVRFGPEVPLIYLLVLINGMARAFGWAARGPFVPNIVPRKSLPNAAIWNCSTFEIGTIVGPAVVSRPNPRVAFPFLYFPCSVLSRGFTWVLLSIAARQPR